MLRLRIEEEGGVRRVPLPGRGATVGRSLLADIQIEEVRASREHLRIEPAGSGALLRDLQSTNGTHLPDRRILQARIAPGDRFRIGETWFTLEYEEPPSRRKKGRLPTILTAALGPALILLILTQVALRALGSTRDGEIDRARQRIELVDYRFASEESNPEKALAALESFLADHPRSAYGEEARAAVLELRPRIARIERARREVGALEQSATTIAFRELRWRYENLLRTYSDLPQISAKLHTVLSELDRTHAEKLSALVSEVRDEAQALAGRGDFGRAISLMTSFTETSPAAAARFESELREAEGQITARAQEAYRGLLEKADALAAAGKAKDGASLLRKQAPRFAGTRFNAFLRLRADAIAARTGGGAPPTKKAQDLLVLRRSYHLLANEAEELAAAGFFSRAAEKYAGILESVRIVEIREEFALREADLRGLAGLVQKVKTQIASTERKFGSVKLIGGRFQVTGLQGDTLLLEIRKQQVKKDWSSLFPEEVVAFFDRAKLEPGERLQAALYCFDMNLRAEWMARILDALERESLRESAGRLFARKEGRPYPAGGYHAYRGKILTGPERAEEMFREQVTKLRDRQATLYDKLAGHPTFAKKLAKLRDQRDELDKARQHALALIFDTVKYFYPYRDRMAEYAPVQMEVNKRVAAVREIWDRPLRVSMKLEGSLKAILKDIDEANQDLRELGVDLSEFEREVALLTMYLGRTLTIRTYFRDRVEASLLTYNDRVMAWNESVESVAAELERRQVRITNEYRIMMGRRALVLNDLLVRTAHGHSDEMFREGYFSHFSPHPKRRTPNLRAKIEGYRGSGMSENIHRGSGMPEGAHRGWTHSSGHHRNLLQRLWTEMGTGQVSNYWTQNFGRTKPKVFPEEGEDRRK